MNKGECRSSHRTDRELSGRVPTTRRVLAGIGLLLAAGSAGASVPGETQFVLNTFSFLIWGALVMWMCAGFTMLESGSVRTKNASVICLKNIGLYSIAGLAFYVIGYNLMYVDVSGWIGSFTLFYGPSADELALLSGQEEAKAAVIENGYSVMSDWFFQMVFVATDGVHRVRHAGRAGEAVVVLRLHHGADRNHLPDRRGLDLGRGMAQRDGLPGLRRLDDRALHRRLGRARRRHGGGGETREVPARRQRSSPRLLRTSRW